MTQQLRNSPSIQLGDADFLRREKKRATSHTGNLSISYQVGIRQRLLLPEPHTAILPHHAERLENALYTLIIQLLTIKRSFKVFLYTSPHRTSRQSLAPCFDKVPLIHK
jgi:hypothetical protein